MVWKGIWSVLFSKDGQDGEEFEEGSWPAMEEEEGNGVLTVGEEGCKMDRIGLSIVIRNLGGKIRECIYMRFLGAPAKELGHVAFSVFEFGD